MAFIDAFDAYIIGSQKSNVQLVAICEENGF